MTHSNATSASRHIRRRLMSGGAVGLAISALILAPQARAQVTPTIGTAFQGTPQVVSGGASIVQTPTVDTIRVTTPQAVIDWTPNDRNGTGTVDFLPEGLRGQFIGNSDFTVLNRIIPVDGQGVPIARLIALNGLISSQVVNAATGTPSPGGNVWFYSPGGILVGNNAVIDVGGLLLTSRDIDTTGGLFGPTGEIRFRNPALAGAAGAVQIAPGAQINARAAITGSAYVAVVAPSIVQAGTIRADGSVALVAAEQADIRINQGLFDINVLVGTDDPHGIIHTGTTGGPSNPSGTYESRAYLVAVPKNQAMTMLLSGTIGFETASSVSIASNGGIVLSAGHNIAGGVAAVRAPGTGAGNISITDSSFRNNLDATASGNINARPDQSCQPLCDSSPTGQLLFNGNATLNGATGVSLSIGQAQQIIVNGNLSLLSATPGQGGSASLTIDNVSPPSSSSGTGIASITGALLIDASARGNPASESGAATGGTASLSVNSGFLSAASISVLANGTGVLAGSSAGGDGTGGTASLSVENRGGVFTGGLLLISADGRGGGAGLTAQQSPVLAVDGGDGRGGTASVTIANASLRSFGSATVSATGYGTAGSSTSGDGFGGTADVDVVTDGSASSAVGLFSDFVLVSARGEGGGSGFDSATFTFISSPDGGNATGGIASFSTTNTSTSNISLGLLVVDAGARGGVASQSSATPSVIVGGDALGGTASFLMDGSSGAIPIGELIVSTSASGGGGIGELARGGNGRGGTSNFTLTNGAVLDNGTSTRIFADGSGGVGQDRSGNGNGGTAIALVAAGARIDTDIIYLTASGVGGGGELAQQSFTPVTTIGGNGSGGTATLTSGGTINSQSIELNANAFGGSSNPASGAASISTGGNAVGGSARIIQTGGSIAADNATIRGNATAGGSATETGASGSSLGGSALLSQTGGAFAITGNLSVEARGYVLSGFGNQLAQTGGSADVSVSVGTLDVDGIVTMDASAGASSISPGLTPSLAITGGSTSFDATNNAVVTLGSLFLSASATGGFNFGDENSGAGAPATGGIGKLRSTSGATVAVENGFRIDTSGTGGFAARGGSGTGGIIDLELDSGSLTLTGPAQLNASGMSGVSSGSSGSTRAFGGSVTITVGSGAASAFKFNALALAATAETALPSASSARGPAPVVASDATGGDIIILIEGGSVTGNQLTVSADGYGSAGGRGTGGSVEFTQTGGTAQFAGVGLSADGFGGTSPPGIENGNGAVVGGVGRGGTTTVNLTGGSITTSFFSASASGSGGSGFTPFFGNGEGGTVLLSGDGGDGFGGSVEVLIDGTAVAGLGSAFFDARGDGGDGGNFITDNGAPAYTPGRGGDSTGGTLFVDLAGGQLSGALFASAGARGGDGGRVFSFNGSGNGFTGLPSDPQPVGGNAVGGFAEIRVATTVSASLSADATAGAGEGGTALSGARGGDASGGFARIFVDDGIDAGSINVSLSAAAFGGRGGRAIHGDGGDGGDGTGGTAAFDITNGATADVLNSNVNVRGVGGDGRSGTINPNFALGSGRFNGGDGGDGTGGTIAIGVTDAELALAASNGEGSVLQSFGYGGFGGDGASNNSGSAIVASVGGDGGDGGHGRGGTVDLSASGGTIDVPGGDNVQIVAGGEGGLGGSGGSGTTVTQINPLTGVTTTTGGSGASGFTGLRIGGTARLEAHDTDNSPGLIDLPSLSINVSGDIGGRVELIDDTAGPGIMLADLFVNTDGAAVISGDFALTGSGVYVSSRAGSIVIDTDLSLTLDGSFRIDAFDTGGLFVDGRATLNVAGTIAGRHGGRAGPTIAADSIDFTASFINFEGGTQLLASDGDIDLDSASTILFGDAFASSGSIRLSAGADIFGGLASAAGFLSSDSGFNTNIFSVNVGDSATMRAGGSLRVGDLITQFGYAELTGNGVALDSGNIAAYLAIAAQAGDAVIGDATVGGEAAVDSDGDIRVNRLTTTGIGGAQTSSAPIPANIRLSAGNDVTLGTLTAADNIFIFAHDLRQQGGESSGPSSLIAGGDIEIDTIGAAAFGSADGGFVDVDAGDDIDFGSISARSGVRLAAELGIDGDDIDTGGQLTVTSAEGSIDIDTSSASGNIAFTAAEGNVIGDFAESRFGTITIRALSVDFGELYAAGNIDIQAEADVTVDYAETGGEGGSQDIQRPLGKNLLAGSSCEDCISASDGDILIVAGDSVALGTLDAFDDIVITAGTLTGATSSLTAGDTLTATIAGSAQFGSLVSGGTMALTAGGTATGQSAQTTGSASGLALSATNGLSVATIRASGTADLTASAGAVNVANLRAVGLVNASGRSVTVSGGTGLLDFQSLRATTGDARVTVGSGDLVVRSGTAAGTLALTTQNGAIETRGIQGSTVTIDSSRGATLNNATTATGVLGVTARNTATINGAASGGSVRITSGDIVIASGARVGTGGTTTDVLLVNGDGTRRTFVGGTGTTSGYSLSAEEMSRVFGGNITIRAPRVSINEGLVASAPGTSIIAPSGEPDLVIDAFSINGGGSATGNLGSAGILRIETPGLARVVGAAQVTNATPNNSFVVSADRSLQVILGSGSLRINGGSGLVGALRLISQDIVVATASAIADIAATTDMAAIDDRLASNDGVLSDEGALSAGTIRFEIGRGLYIQNSGNGEGFDDRRGFTAGTGGVSIFTGETSSTAGGGAARLVINGRTTGETGEVLTGIDAFTRISVNQTLLTGDSQVVNGLDTGSTINGCLIVSASNCFQFEIDLIPPIQDNPLVDLDDEESEQTGDDDPLNVTVIVEIKDVDEMSNQPVVDEPVTGSGNDDLWTPGTE